MSLGTVLIVDDEPELLELLDYNLRSGGFDTLRAADGLTACRAIGEHRPDLVLLDLLLPDLDGREICRLVRQTPDPAVACTPILMLTALATDADRITGLALGADDYVAKPFSVEEVVLRSKRLVARERARRECAVREAAAAQRQDRLKEAQEILFHELKNQLLVMKGFSGRLAASGTVLPLEKVRTYAGAIHQSASHLASVADDVLAVARIEGGDVDLPAEDVDVCALIDEARNAHQGFAAERRIRLTTECEGALPALRVHRGSARLVLSCLTDNALKYGREGGEVCLRGRKERDGRLVVSVSDDGQGIPEGELDRVFEKFYRGENAARLTQGTGLGLYVVKTLTEGMGGFIRVQSVVGRGSRFELIWPG